MRNYCLLNGHARDLVSAMSFCGSLDPRGFKSERKHDVAAHLKGYFRAHNDTVPHYTEQVQFTAGNTSSYYFLNLCDSAGNVIPETIWRPELTRPNHFLNGWSGWLLDNGVSEPLPAPPTVASPAGLSLLRHRLPNTKHFEEFVQFASADGKSFFLALKDQGGAVLSDSLWEREALHPGHELMRKSLALIAGAAWEVRERRGKLTLCRWTLPDGRQFEEFLQTQANVEDGQHYFLCLGGVGEEDAAQGWGV